MLKIGIITGSTRPNRNSIKVANKLKEWADKRGDAEYEVVDIADYNLPLYNEPISAAYSSDYVTPEAKPWSEKIASLDGFVFVTPEYNHGITSAMKNAIDYLYVEYNNKPAGIVSYGSSGGVRAAEALRVVLAELQVASVRTHVVMSLFTDFEDMSEFTPAALHEETFNTQLDQVLSWGEALKTVREK